MNKLRPLIIGLVAFWIVGLPALSPADDGLWRRLEDGGRATVVDVVDGDTLTLASGETVRLVGLQAPKLPLGRPGYAKWPLADEAKQRVSELIRNKPMRLFYGGRRFDRYGRKLAHVWRTDKYGEPALWLQGALLETGLARVYTFADNRALAAEMLARERRARVEPAGMWADPYYEVLTPEDADRQIDSFQVVAGRVADTAMVRGRGYINFGDDWHTDFTIALAPKVLRDFPDLAAQLPNYKGKKIRVRGWIKRYNGPMIEVTHPEQIEVTAIADNKDDGEFSDE